MPGREHHREEVRRCRERHGADAPEVDVALGALADAMADECDWAGAASVADEILRSRCRLLGPGDTDTLRAATRLASALAPAGDLQAARALGRELATGLAPQPGDIPAHHELCRARLALADTLVHLGVTDEARRQAEAAVAGIREVRPQDSWGVLNAERRFADLLHDMGDDAAARALRRDVARRAEPITDEAVQDFLGRPPTA